MLSVSPGALVTREKYRTKPFQRSATWFRQRRKAMHMSQDDLADLADVSQGLVSQLEGGRHSPTDVSFGNLVAIARALNATLADLIAHSDLEGELPMLGAYKEIEDTATRKIPLYGEVSAGEGGLEAEQIGWTCIPVNWAGQYAAYRVKGESMSGEIDDGANVVVRLQPTAEIGDRVVAFVPDVGMVVKRLAADSKQSVRILRSANPNYADLIHPEARIIGKVREVRVHEPNGW